MNSLKICIILLSLGLFNSTYCQKISKISYEGLTKTKESYLNSFIKSKIGNEFDTIVLAQDVANLKNLNLFFEVASSHVTDDENSTSVTFRIKEANYIYPTIQIDGFNDVLKIQLGANNINWRGRGYTLGGFYQFYDRHSFKVYQKSPRHKNNKTGHEIILGKYSTVEPLYKKDTASKFNFDNYSVSIGGYYWLNQNIHFSLGTMYMYETYESLENNFYMFPAGSMFNFNKLQVRGYFEINKVNQHFELRDGIYYKLHLENIRTQNYSEINFVKLVQEIKWFKSIKNWSNIAIRSRIGIATNNDSPFSPFVIDGFINIRGVGNRVARGTAELLLNSEFRFRTINTKHIIIQSVIYNDIGVLRQPGETFNLMFSENTYIYSGLGLRFNLRTFYNTTFRIDYGINMQNPSLGGFSFGFGQFF